MIIRYGTHLALFYRRPFRPLHMYDCMRADKIAWKYRTSKDREDAFFDICPINECFWYNMHLNPTIFVEMLKNEDYHMDKSKI